MTRLTIARIKGNCVVDGACLVWAGRVYKKNGNPCATENIDKVERYVGVRRRAYEEYTGATLTKGQLVATTCGNPACLAKKHLEIITGAERSRRMHASMDAATKAKRSQALARAQQALRGKMKADQVQAIKDSPDGPYVTAKRLGVSGVVASRIQNGTSWRDYTASPFAGLGARASNDNERSAA